MNDRIFVDTNILVYAHDLSAGDRHAKASTVIESLWEAETGVISTQVLQEFYVTVTRKNKLWNLKFHFATGTSNYEIGKEVWL